RTRRCLHARTSPSRPPCRGAAAPQPCWPPARRAGPLRRRAAARCRCDGKFSYQHCKKKRLHEAAVLTSNWYLSEGVTDAYVVSGVTGAGFSVVANGEG